MPVETRSQKVLSNYSPKHLRTAAVRKKAKNVSCFLLVFLTAAGGAICFFSLQIANTLLKI